MARERAKLTEKEERILIQAQLMGLSTGSMIKIGNRLKAIEKDREDQARIDEDCQGYSWAKIAGGWAITNADGYVSEFTNQQKGKGSWYNTTYNYTIKVHKPGTRFKARTFKKKELRISDLWRARMCPGGSKHVYAMVRWCHGLKAPNLYFGESMTEGERAGRWAMIYLYTALFALWFNIVAIAAWHIKEWFL